jgi:hypothetical protein
MEAHTCNPRCLGGRDWEDHGLGKKLVTKKLGMVLHVCNFHQVGDHR